MGVGRLRRCFQQYLPGAPQPGPAHAAAFAEQGVPDPAACRQTPGLAPVRSPHAAQLGALQRPGRLHAVPLVRGFCLRGERPHRYPQHRDPRGSGHRQLRGPHRLDDPRNPSRRSRPSQRRGLFRSQRPAPAADCRPGDCLLRSRRIRPSAAQHQAPAVPQRPGQSLRLGRTESSRPYLPCRRRPVRLRHLRRHRPRRLHRHLRFQPRQPRPRRRRHARQRVHPPAVPVHEPGSAVGAALGAGAQGFRARPPTSGPLPSWARCRRCRCSTPASRWIRK